MHKAELTRQASLHTECTVKRPRRSGLLINIFSVVHIGVNIFINHAGNHTRNGRHPRGIKVLKLIVRINDKLTIAGYILKPKFWGRLLGESRAGIRPVFRREKEPVRE